MDPGPLVVAGARLAVEHRRRIPRAHVEQVQRGIVGAGHPHLAAGGATADRIGRAWRRRAVERPLQRARFGIEGLEDAGEIVEVAGYADDQVIPDDERRIRGPVAAPCVGDFDVPSHTPGARIERHQMRVGRRQVHEIAPHGGAAVADLEPFVRRIAVTPDLTARAPIDRPQVVRRCQVDHAVDQDRRCLDLLGDVRLERPGERHPVHVVRRDLGQATVMLSAVIAVIRGPTVNGRRTQQIGRDALPQRRRGECHRQYRTREAPPCASGVGRARPTEASADTPERRACRHRCTFPTVRRAPEEDRPRRISPGRSARTGTTPKRRSARS